MREQLHLPHGQEEALVNAIEAVFQRYAECWQDSKEAAVHAVSTGSSARVRTMRDKLAEREATIRDLGQFIEGIVADLADRAHRDPKTRLLNSRRFTEQLEAFLAVEQRGTWCAVGLVDITSFKWYNDTFGHALGDAVINRVARLLREQVRARDVITQGGGRELHARLGGDEFCFLIPSISGTDGGREIARRFSDAVRNHAWATDDPRLADVAVTVDIGVVCVDLGPLAERRDRAAPLAAELLALADSLMYNAKRHKAGRVSIRSTRIRGGRLDTGRAVQPADAGTVDRMRLQKARQASPAFVPAQLPRDTASPRSRAAIP
jgi:diguanylate cyclase (GGDEF)-like protein